MLEKKALNIKIIKVDKLTTLTDYFINCSSDSDPQTRAIKNHIQDILSSKYNIKPLHIEGFENLQWILMDYEDTSSFFIGILLLLIFLVKKPVNIMILKDYGLMQKYKLLKIK